MSHRCLASTDVLASVFAALSLMLVPVAGFVIGLQDLDSNPCTVSRSGPARNMDDRHSNARGMSDWTCRKGGSHTNEEVAGLQKQAQSPVDRQDRRERDDGLLRSVPTRRSNLVRRHERYVAWATIGQSAPQQSTGLESHTQDDASRQLATHTFAKQ